MNRHPVYRAKAGCAVRFGTQVLLYYVCDLGLGQGVRCCLFIAAVLRVPAERFRPIGYRLKKEPRRTQSEGIWGRVPAGRKFRVRVPAPQRWRVAWLSLVIAEVLRLESVKTKDMRPSS